MARTKNALKILEKVTGKDPVLREEIANARINLKVAQMIHDSRTKAGLSQRQLADLIGSKQPVIARLEDADYEGYSLTMLQRIAEALDQRLELRFVPSAKHTALKSRRSARRPPNRQLQPA
jgi:ribosome-binding protein aMBF1 (putative translation factor)